MQPAPPATASSPADERRALARITWYAVLNLVNSFVGVATGVGVFSAFAAGGLGFNPGASIGQSGPTALQLQAMTQAFRYMTELVPVVLTLSLLSLILLWTGFRGLSKVGVQSLSLPSKFIIVVVVGLLALLPGTLLVYTSIVPLMVSLAPGNAPPGVASSLSPLFLGVALTAIGAILGLVGVIGGVLLGLWRVGSRYDQTVLKVGAIFVIIPLLSLISPILVLVGVSGAKRKVGQSQPAAQ